LPGVRRHQSLIDVVDDVEDDRGIPATHLGALN
jgi:hypothetical protein